MDIIVHSGFGIETATKLELRRLGYDAPAEGGRFLIDGQSSDIPKLNLNLRTADRVSVRVAKFEAHTFDEFFDGVHAVDWSQFVVPDAKIIVNAKSVDSDLFALSALQSVGKKAIVSKLLLKYKALPEDGAEHRIEFSLIANVVSVLIDTSGVGLHKRGYRDLVYEAPIKETIAAAILQLSVWNPSRILVDCFCGSGTFAIEAAMRAINMPAGLHRNFLFEHYDFVDNSILPRLKREAEDAVEWDKKTNIYGYDINPRAITLAHHHAQNFGLDKYIHFETCDMRDLNFSKRYGVIVSNPPYGERLMTDKEIKVLYLDFGKVFRSLPDWSTYIITACEDFEDYFGKKADKTRKIFNAALPCRLYQYLGEAPPKRKKPSEVDNGD